MTIASARSVLAARNALSSSGLGPRIDVVVHAPRLLNGAQTVSTFADFWERTAAALRTASAEQLAVTLITVNANRQNPMQPWQLHAKDLIQFELEDWFKALKDKEYKAKAEDGNYSFMRAPAAFKRAMKYAGERGWRWQTQLLR